MDTVERLAAKLADDTMKAMQEIGDDRLYIEIGDVLAAASQTLEEAYLTEMRVRLAEITARKFLIRKMTEARARAKPATTAASRPAVKAQSAPNRPTSPGGRPGR